jgi:hypothetical protein
MEPDDKPDQPDRKGAVAREVFACLMAAVILTAAAYALTRLVLGWTGVG